MTDTIKRLIGMLPDGYRFGGSTHYPGHAAFSFVSPGGHVYTIMRPDVAYLLTDLPIAITRAGKVERAARAVAYNRHGNDTKWRDYQPMVNDIVTIMEALE